MKRTPDALRIARRGFLRGLSGVTLALPFLPSLMGEGRAGEPSKRAKRFVFLFSSNGQRPENWYPADPASWTVRSAAGFVREAPLAPYDTEISPILGADFVPLREKLLLFRGLDSINSLGGGHNAATPLNAFRVDDRPTIDQILANSSHVYASPPPVRSAHCLIKQAFQSETTCSIDTSGQRVPHVLSTAVLYQQLFGTFIPPDDMEANARVVMRARVLDRVKAEYDVVRSSSRLGSEDRARLEAHVALIDDLQSRLVATGAVCTPPQDPGELDLGQDENLEPATDIVTDLLVAAFACDRTRVATYMLCPGTDLRDFAFLGGPGGDHHSISHDAAYDAGKAADLAVINNWYGTKVAALLSGLDAIEEDPTTGATLLDNAIVYWGNEDGCNGYDAHAGWAMPVLLAGGGGGAFETGRYIDYRSESNILFDYQGSPADIPTDRRGRPFNSLLISILQAFGLEPADYEQPGEPGFGDYAGNYQDQYSIEDGQQPLPFLDS